MTKMKTLIFVAPLFAMLALMTQGNLLASAGCSKADSYYTFNVPKGWKFSASGG